MSGPPATGGQSPVTGSRTRKVVPRPGSDPNALTGLAKINVSTGEIMRFDVGRTPGNGAMLATAGNLVFHGDMNRRFRAFDESTGKELWTEELDASGNAIPITYQGRDGKQYVVIAAGGGGHIGGNRPTSDSLIAFSLPN